MKKKLQGLQRVVLLSYIHILYLRLPSVYLHPTYYVSRFMSYLPYRVNIISRRENIVSGGLRQLTPPK
jgi:hypothetical protein